jgi:DNA repair protein RadA
LQLEELEGLGPLSLKRLNEVGVKTLKDLITLNPVKIVEICGESSKKYAEDWFNIAMKYLEERGDLLPPIRSALDIYKDRKKNLEIISTGCNALNEILYGGIEVGATTEVYGEFKSGKSQLMHTLAVMVQLPKDKGGLNGQVLWIDSEDTFRPERIEQILCEREVIESKEQTKEEKKALKPKQAKNEKEFFKYLSGITVVKPKSAFHQHNMVQHISDFFKEDSEEVKKSEPKIRLVIIDSLTRFWRGEYQGRGQLSARQIGINDHVMLISKIPELYKVAVVYTNQVTSSVDPFGDPIKAVGGNIVGHANTYRIYLKKSYSKHIARIIDSPYHADSEVQFALSPAGIVDFEEKKKKE